MTASRLFLAIAAFVSCTAANAVTYAREDSITVVRLLAKGAAQPKGTNLMLFYAGQFTDKPYVSRTLEVNDEEQLAVNLGQLDCLTFVETTAALTLATLKGKGRWSDFLYWLQTLRYQDGKIDGYSSRNHYFSQWIQSNSAQGLVAEIGPAEADGDKFPFTAIQDLRLDYMTSHPQSYPALMRDTAERRRIAERERGASGRKVRYIPKELTGKSKAELKYIEDGDILAIVTRKKGLDVSHVGIAKWGEDGKLHLLNASSIHKKVVLEPMTLRQYMDRHPSQLGVRVIRLRRATDSRR